jgi:hypothetical protein
MVSHPSSSVVLQQQQLLLLPHKVAAAVVGEDQLCPRRKAGKTLRHRTRQVLQQLHRTPRVPASLLLLPQ